VSFDLAEFYAQLPRKRVAAGVLYRNAAGDVLLVEPAYKPTWEIPGGSVEPDESPRQAARREVVEELGAELPVHGLLVVDWVEPAEPRPDGLMFVFDGGVVSDAVATRITLPAAELLSWRWCDRAAVRSLTMPRLAARVLAALDALGAGATFLENGATPGSDRHVPSWQLPGHPLP
jgi:8-oxo-dGTP pyrophosphatase MutT (NUDIX family)